ncbi:DUF2076 domain-containing protein [Methylocystis sp. IM4]|uniref:DUF2076 domain-containing protein n=1 Tax=Methylocystis sp. IM4 TaxID=3136560 RepID=UPI003119DA26
MLPEERKLLAGLFERIKAASTSPRDKEAETFINEQICAQPAAPYLLAQTIIVQDQALQGANQRIGQLEARLKELEATAQKGAGSFLGGLLGGGAAMATPSASPTPRPASPSGFDQPQGGPWGAQRGYAPSPAYPPQGGYASPPQPAPSAGGGFLKGALGAAAGVAGGVLLADSIRGLLHGGAGGMGSLAGAEPVHKTVINNYYGDADSNAPGEQIQHGYQDQYDSQSQDAGYGGDGFDSGGDSYDV